MILSEFAVTVRKFITYSLIGALLFLLLWGMYRLAVNLYYTFNPLPEPAPTVGFDKLPELNLPSLTITEDPIYLLETPTAELPTFADRAEVVGMVPTQPTLLGEEKARDLAKELDFGGSGELSVNRKTLTFQDTLDQRTLAVNVVTQNFTLTTDLNRITTFSPGNAPSGPDAIKQAEKILKRLGLLKFGFGEGNQTTTFRAASGGAIKKVGSISEAQLTEVNFFRSLTEVSSQSYPILPPNPKVGLIQVWVTTDLKPTILNTLSISYNAQELQIDKTKVETYPLKDIADAWEEVKNQKKVAFVEVSGELSTITITDVSLAYFDDKTHQEYLQPIYVFSGVAKTTNKKKGEFITYVSAVSKDWIKE